MTQQFTTILIALLLASGELFSQNDEGFIYGKITTIDGDVYEGPIRWGKEEVYWTDMFNAGKRENENLQYLSRAEMDALDRHKHRHEHWGIHVNWDWDWSNDHKHQFGCEFGNLKRITVRGRERVEIELQSGVEMLLSGEGYNDVNSRIRVLDRDLGEVVMRWSRIDEIEFLPTPKKLKDKFGEPLYGTVETRGRSFTGYIQWDHDERVSTDKLDGDTRDGDLSLPFDKIKSIERDGGGSTVVLLSGREIFMKGTNDVDDDNRGIIVTTDFGRVDIEWDEFEKVTFERAPGSGKAFDYFQAQDRLKGTVTTEDGESVSGHIVFDLDESYDFEVLHGEDDDENEYLVPFRNIVSIKPGRYDESEVVLKNGQKFTFEESQDVSDENSGLLVFDKDDDPIYIPWDEVEDIQFK